MGIIPCSNQIFKRLIEIPSRPGNFILCEELILHFASKLFKNYSIREKTVLRITRNADIDANDMLDEDLDYRNFMAHLIKQRKKMSPVRLELSRKINSQAKKELSEILGIDYNHIINIETPLDLKFVFELQRYLKKQPLLFYKKRIPKNPANIKLNRKLIPQMENKDYLLSFPFESIKPFLSLLHEAANDKFVVSIKTC